MRTAIACSNCARCMPSVGGLHLRRLKLRPRLRHVGKWRCASIVTVLRQLKRVLVGLYSLVQQLLLSINTAQAEVVDSQFGMKAQPRGLHSLAALACACSRADVTLRRILPHKSIS